MMENDGKIDDSGMNYDNNFEEYGFDSSNVLEFLLVNFDHS